MVGSDVEAKVVVLGSQGVGKTSLVHRYVKNAFANTTSTVGASFLTKKVVDIDTSTVVRLQIWDTAGQERYRSISKLYYRGANAAVLCYDITDVTSFEEMGRWLIELKNNLGDDLILHVVGTKLDRLAEDPSARQVPFERCIAYVAENLYPLPTPQSRQTAPLPKSLWNMSGVASVSKDDSALTSPRSNRSSGFWGQEVGWDCCHEISAKDGEGVEEVFRVITRKLVDQRNKRLECDLIRRAGTTPADPGQGGYFAYSSGSTNNSFRIGGDRRKSWLGFPSPMAGPGGPVQTPGVEEWNAEIERIEKKGGRCC